MTEQEARDLIAEAFDAANWTAAAAAVRTGSYVGGAHIVVRALLPLLATSDLERRALEACEEYAKGWDEIPMLSPAGYARNACAIGRESLAAKKPKGPWTQSGCMAMHSDGRVVTFQKSAAASDESACAAFVAEQNEREAGRV